jgi:chorismate mutase/prephenate dehydratase
MASGRSDKDAGGSGDRLEALRALIDDLDVEVQSLINRRARCVLEIADVKRRAGDDSSFYRPDREAMILRRVIDRHEGPLPREEITRLFREIMSACLALEQPMHIAFLGPEGTFTQAAALKHFGHSVTTVPLGAIDEVFREVEAGNCDFGVVPVENSTEGVISHTLDVLLNSSLRICGEIQFRIHHFLLSSATAIEAIRTLVSHEQSLAQCREWITANLPGVEVRTASSNAEAARRVVGDAAAAAIAGGAAAEIYQLNVLARNIEDTPDNTTRFLVLGKIDTRPTGSDKTSLVLTGHNKPGALYQLLEPLKRHGVSMTRIESRPSRRGLWEYVFFVDIEGHVADAPVARAMAELEDQAMFVKWLGSYPKSVI